MRTFIALPLPEEIKSLLLGVQEDWRRNFHEPASWSRVESFHLTLKFLGEIKPEQVPGIEAVIEKAAEETPTLELSLGAAACFPNPRSPRVLTVGISADALTLLASRLEEGLEPLGFPREKRRFNGHVTLGRVRVPKRLEEPYLPTVEPRQWPAREIVLYESHLSPHGSRYERLFTAWANGCAGNP